MWNGKFRAMGMANGGSRGVQLSGVIGMMPHYICGKHGIEGQSKVCRRVGGVRHGIIHALVSVLSGRVAALLSRCVCVFFGGGRGAVGRVLSFAQRLRVQGCHWQAT